MMNLTEQERDALIADCKADISCARTLMLAAINIRDRETTAKYESQLRRHEIALASLTAPPIYQVKLDDAWVDLSEGAMRNQLRHGTTARTVYAAPPVPVMKPVKLPKSYSSAIAGPGCDERFMAKSKVIAALREAGIQIEGEE